MALYTKGSTLCEPTSQYGNIAYIGQLGCIYH